MGEVIGYKGTPKERMESWLTMLLLRKSISWSKSAGAEFYRPSLEKEQNWYKEELLEYRAA